MEHVTPGCPDDLDTPRLGKAVIEQSISETQVEQLAPSQLQSVPNIGIQHERASRVVLSSLSASFATFHASTAPGEANVEQIADQRCTFRGCFESSDIADARKSPDLR